jgi:hypothetical protein
VKLTGTNRPITYTTHHPAQTTLQKRLHPSGAGTKSTRLHASTMWFPTNKPNTQGYGSGTSTIEYSITTVVTPQVFPPPTTPGGSGNRVTAVIAWGKRPVPFRTRKLRPTAPMVLHPGGCGRVGHRRTTIRKTVESPNQPWLGLSRI